MKNLILFIIAIIVFFTCFNYCGNVINWLLVSIMAQPLHFILWCVLWFIFFGVIIQVSFWVTAIVITILDKIFGG